ncbi:MAG: methyltransferase domain-containing protein, partial [Candidatus Bathyarchaeota archaeon]|nr:methyltransferase domain-containing protein [Candidatus Bathyarchaeota archaeon]
ILADVRFLPFRRGVFTSIICNHVLEHVEDDFKVMEEAISSLSFDGRIYISSPNTYKRALILIQLEYRVGDKHHGHLRHYKA